MTISQLMKRSLILSLSAIAMSACTPSRPSGFGLAGSPIRYTTTKFEDSDQIAEVNGIKFTRSQILDKSAVVKDLNEQENEAMIGLVYLNLVDKASWAKEVGQKNNAVVYLPASEKPLEQILARFGRKPVSGIGISYGKETDGSVLGKLNQFTVKRDDINVNNAALQTIEKRRYTEMISQLDHQLSRILINEQAMKEKTPIQEFIDKTVLGGQRASISDEELKAYLKKIGFAESELTPELKAQFTASLSQQKEQNEIEEYVAKKILKGPIATSIQEPTIAIHLSENWKPVAGYDSAPISVVAFAGTTCPDCSKFLDTVQEMMTKYKGNLRLNWINSFNSDDGVARMMAQAALCAESEKRGSSLPFMRHFASEASQVDETSFYKWASANGIDQKSFKACFVGQQQNPLLDQHLAYVQQAGIFANPAIWIDGQLIEGIVGGQDVDDIIKNDLAEKQISPWSAFKRRLFSKSYGL